jgi:hypothetical protein
VKVINLPSHCFEQHSKESNLQSLRKRAYLGEDSDGEADGVMILAPVEEHPSPPFYFQTQSPLISCSF